MKRSGFTLLEMLVASSLLAMLVTILTMLFSQSSIAWSTGTASVAGMSDVRKAISRYQLEAENAILNDGATPKALKVTSIWAEDGNGLKTGSDARRTLSKLNESWQKEPKANDFADPATGSAGEVPTISASAASGRPAYIVGVTSWGPDGAPGTWDDITTLPEEVVK